MAPIKRALNKINSTDDGGGSNSNPSRGGKRRRSFATLTSVHSDLCKLALASKCFTPVLPMLTDQDLIDINREAVLADSKYILLYFYYGGMILTAIKVL